MLRNRYDTIDNEVYEAVTYLDHPSYTLSRIETFIAELKDLLVILALLSFFLFQVITLLRTLRSTPLTADPIQTDSLIKAAGILWVLVVNFVFLHFITRWRRYKRKANKMFGLAQELREKLQQGDGNQAKD